MLHKLEKKIGNILPVCLRQLLFAPEEPSGRKDKTHANPSGKTGSHQITN